MNSVMLKVTSFSKIDMNYVTEYNMISNHYLPRNNDVTKIWHGNEHARGVTGETMYKIDPPHGEKIMASTIGILHAFQFLEDVLLSRAPRNKVATGKQR